MMRRIRSWYFILVVLIHCPLVYAGWEIQESGISGNFYQVSFFDQFRGWARGDSTSRETLDGGKTWFRPLYTAGSYPDSSKWYNHPFVVNENIGFMGTNFGKILSTHDGGTTWNEMTVLEDTTSFVDVVRFFDTDTGWVRVRRAYSETFSLFRTSDGGKTWKEVSQLPFFNDMDFINARTGWMLGGQNTTEVYRTDDGGENWNKTATFQHFPPCQELTVISPDTLLVCHPFLAVSTDGGYSWNETHEYVSIITKVSSLRYWKCNFTTGSQIISIHYTEDGGNTFSEIFSGSLKKYQFNAMYGLSNGMLWVVGQKGLIMKYTPESAGVSDARTTPPPFRVYPNSPNPFNAQTTIRFSCSSRERIKLSIYDATGKLVRTLSDGIYPPGMHSVTWDGHDSQGKIVSSGLFIYRLNGESHDETHKMLFLK